MKKQTTFRKTIEKVWKNRAAIVIAIAATVFMCGLTALEFVALRMEWNLPVLAYVTGDSDSYIFEEYRSDEMKLDESTENVMLEEDMLQGESQSENSGKDITQGESQSEDDIVPGEGKNENVRQEDTVQGENQQEKDSQQSASDEAEFPYYIKVNRRQNCITVYTSDENGEYTVPYKAMICSTGLYNATPRGTFHLSTKYLWRELYGKVYGQYATRITGGVLFHSVPYYKKSKVLCAQKNIINLDSRHLWDVCGLRWKMQNGSQITVHREQPWKFMRMMIRDHWENLRQHILILTVRIKAGIRQIRT